MIFKAIFAQVRAPWAKMAEMCENVLITVKVIDIVLIGGPESFQVIVKVLTKIVDRLWISTILESVVYRPPFYTTSGYPINKVI